MTVKTELNELLAELRTERDELKVQAHLLKAELRDEWQEIEGKWHDLESRVNVKAKGAARTTRDFADASRELGKDIRAAYRRFRAAL